MRSAHSCGSRCARSSRVRSRGASANRRGSAGFAAAIEIPWCSPHVSRLGAELSSGCLLREAAAAFGDSLFAHMIHESGRIDTSSFCKGVGGSKLAAGSSTCAFARVIGNHQWRSVASARVAQQGVAADPRPVVAKLSVAKPPFVASDPWHASGNRPSALPAGRAPGVLRWPRAAERQSVGLIGPFRCGCCRGSEEECAGNAAWR